MMPMLDAQVGAAYVMRYPVDDSNIWPRMPLSMHFSSTEIWRSFVEQGDLRAHPCNDGIMARLGSDFTATRQELVDDQVWNSSPFRSSIANPAGWDQTLHSQTMLNPPGFINGLDFMRAVGKPPFSQREVDLMHHAHGELARLWRRHDPLDIHLLPGRQRQALDGIRRGESRNTIAEKMGVSDHTVHSYERALFEKAGVTSRGELLARLSAVLRPNLLP